MSEQSRNQYDPQPARQRSKYALTPEEEILLKECRNESFYYCVPLSFVMGFGAQYLRHIGILKGKYLGLSVALAIGYFTGKLAYLPVCRKKFEERLPNSLFHQLNSGKISQQEYMNLKEREFQLKDTPQYNNRPTELDNKLPTVTTDDFNSDVGNEESGVRKNVTYEELRQKHRAQYNQPYSQPSAPKDKFDMQRIGVAEWNNPRLSEKARIPKDEGKQNKYGDVWDDGK